MKQLPPKYDFQTKEKYWSKYWQKNKIYSFDPDSAQKIFSVDTPPPTVSASHLHTGHVMSYTQADIIVRYKRMKGYNIYYPMGFDDNGVPTERHTEKTHEVEASKYDRKKFIELCLQETRKCSKEYKKLWDTTGISVDWNYSYSTIDKKFQKISQNSFLKLQKKEWPFKKRNRFTGALYPKQPFPKMT